MSESANNIQVQTINHLGIIAGIIDEIGIVEIINEQLGIKTQEKLNNGIIVKSIILNAMGFVSRPLYLFTQFFNDKATEHLFGEGIAPEDFNDDKIGRVMDKLYQFGLTKIFLLIALTALKKSENRTEIKVVFECEQKKLKSHDLVLKDVTKTTDKKSKKTVYKATIIFEQKSEQIAEEQKKAGRFILATNVFDNLSPSDILTAYKEQQSCERGFRFLKDPLFFAADRFSKISVKNRNYGDVNGVIFISLHYRAKRT